MWWWRFKQLEDDIFKRSRQKRCSRCGLLYDPLDDGCLSCKDISDERLDQAIKGREQKMATTGHAMLYLAVAVFALILMFFMGS